MNQFYAPPEQITDILIEITGQEAHHILNVLRYDSGDDIVVTDGIGGRYHAKIIRTGKDDLVAEIKGHEKITDPADRSIVVAFGAIKHRPRLEFAVEKAVELGATEIVIFQGQHSERSHIRTDRLEGVVLSAMKQSLRTLLPRVRIFNNLDIVVSQYGDHKIVITHEKSRNKPGIPPSIGREKRLLLLIGPEGGFSNEEVKSAEAAGGVIVSLGDYRLRTETAVIAILAQLISL